MLYLSYRAVIIAVIVSAGIIANGYAVNRNAAVIAAPKPLSTSARTEDWPHYLGPAFDMTSRETKLQKDLAGSLRVVWALEKGDGYATPAVAGDRLILFHRIDDESVIECRNTVNGSLMWEYRYPTAYRDRYGYHGGPRAGAVIGNGMVFALGADGELFALSLTSGGLHWRHNIMTMFNVRQNFFGVGASPLIYGDTLIVNVGAADAAAVAFDCKTGAVRWSAGNGWGASYAMPVPADIAGRKLIALFAGGESNPPTGGLLMFDPKSGTIAASFPWRGTRVESVNATPPVVIGGNIFISECYGAGTALVSPSGAAVWTNEDVGIHFMTPIVRDGHLYGVDGHGPGNAFLFCMDTATGAVLWKEKPQWKDIITNSDGEAAEVNTGTVRCSFIYADNAFLCLGEFGHLLWMDMTRDGYRITSRTRLFYAGETWSPPVVSKGLLYVCQNRRDKYSGKPARIICYDLRGQ
ncbi:MAG: PQQ-like beta-propeller repeat protein [Spirochaetes bacterium]|nr:PQQ-like beta-propeller repeat protein [Spirochaetota bacterium]